MDVGAVASDGRGGSAEGSSSSQPTASSDRATIAAAVGVRRVMGCSSGVADCGDADLDRVVVDVEDAQQPDVDLAVQDDDDLGGGGVDLVAGEQIVDVLAGETASSARCSASAGSS